MAVNHKDVGSNPSWREKNLEITGFEPVSLCLQNIHSTIELFSHNIGEKWGSNPRILESQSNTKPPSSFRQTKI